MVKSVLIADDQEVIRHMLCLMFASQDDFEVCGEAENGQEALEMAQILRPDLIMLDLSMPVMSGIEAACALKRLMPMTPIIVFSEYSDVFRERSPRNGSCCTRLEDGEYFSTRRKGSCGNPSDSSLTKNAPRNRRRGIRIVPANLLLQQQGK